MGWGTDSVPGGSETKKKVHDEAKKRRLVHGDHGAPFWAAPLLAMAGGPSTIDQY